MAAFHPLRPQPTIADISYLPEQRLRQPYRLHEEGYGSNERHHSQHSKEDRRGPEHRPLKGWDDRPREVQDRLAGNLPRADLHDCQPSDEQPQGE
jgi:hypothetical protein